MMIAFSVHLSAVLAPQSLALVLRLVANGSKMLAAAAAVWLALALPGFLSERDSTLGPGNRPGALAHSAQR